MPKLYEKDGNKLVGEISVAQLEFLSDALVEESEQDTDYYFNEATLEYLEEEGADQQLVDLLRKALGGREEIELRWEA